MSSGTLPRVPVIPRSVRGQNIHTTHTTLTNVSAACMEDVCVCMCVRACVLACVRGRARALSLACARSLCVDLHQSRKSTEQETGNRLASVSRHPLTLDARTRGTPTESDAHTHTRTHLHMTNKKTSPSPGSQSFLTHKHGLQNDPHCTLKEVHYVVNAKNVWGNIQQVLQPAVSLDHYQPSPMPPCAHHPRARTHAHHNAHTQMCAHGKRKT